MTQYESQIPTQISYQLTEKDYLASLGLHLGKQRKFLPIMIGLIALAGGLATGSVMFALAFSIGITLYLGAIFWFISRAMKRNFRSTPQLQVEQRMQFDHDGLAYQSRYAIAKVSWQIYQRYEVNDRYYLLYQSPQLFNIIPKSAFISEEQEDAFRMLLELNVKPGKSVKRKPNT